MCNSPVTYIIIGKSKLGFNLTVRKFIFAYIYIYMYMWQGKRVLSQKKNSFIYFLLLCISGSYLLGPVFKRKLFNHLILE